jgi:hypothetical protein
VRSPVAQPHGAGVMDHAGWVEQHYHRNGFHFIDLGILLCELKQCLDGSEYETTDLPRNWRLLVPLTFAFFAQHVVNVRTSILAGIDNRDATKVMLVRQRDYSPKHRFQPKEFFEQQTNVVFP